MDTWHLRAANQISSDAHAHFKVLPRKHGTFCADVIGKLPFTYATRCDWSAGDKYFPHTHSERQDDVSGIKIYLYFSSINQSATSRRDSPVSSKMQQNLCASLVLLHSWQ